ncbi:MAG: hypothetical protein ACYS21_04455, partial [Planctomycetota bacterium]
EYSEYGFGGRAVGWEPSVGSCIGQCEGDWLKGYSIIERDIEVDGRDAAGVASNPFDGVAGVGDISFAAVGDDDGDAGRGGVTSGAGDKVVLYVDEIDIGDAADVSGFEAGEGWGIGEGGGVGYFGTVTETVAVGIISIEAEDVGFVAIGGGLDGQSVEISGSAATEVVMADAAMSGVAWYTVQYGVFCLWIDLEECFAVGISCLGALRREADGQENEREAESSTKAASVCERVL